MSTKSDKTPQHSEESESVKQNQATTQLPTPLKCGIIMPIADNPDLGYPLGHWSQVRDIVIGAAESAGFEADMVSNDTQVDLIHATIIKNIYANDVAVCDVSSRNPNVMFELGLRIASKKPVILIKDDITPFSFDTQLIPHLAYRRDLRMYETLDFQKQLRNKIRIAHEEAQQQGYKSFLEQFTSYTLAQVEEQQVGVPEYFLRVADQMQRLEDMVKNMSSSINNTSVNSAQAIRIPKMFYGGELSISEPNSVIEEINIKIRKFLVEHKLENRRFAVTDTLISNIVNYLLKDKSSVTQYMDKERLSQLVNNYLLESGI